MSNLGSNLDDLYREIILDHYRSPRNRGELPTPPARRAEGFNPLCGDEVVVYVDVDGDTLKDIRISGQGCSISQSSASLMSGAVKGKTLAEVRHLIRTFKAMMSIHEARLGETEGDTAYRREFELWLDSYAEHGIEGVELAMTFVRRLEPGRALRDGQRHERLGCDCRGGCRTPGADAARPERPGGAG